MSLACSQNLLQSRLHLRRTGANAHGARQVVGGADEQGADARRRCDGIEILQALHRFDHENRNQVAFGIERPQVGVPIVFIAADSPDPRGIGGSRTSRAVRLVVLGALQLRVPHAFDGNQRLFSRIDAIENDSMQPDVQCLFDNPLRLVGLGRKARKQGDTRLQVALLENHGPIRHSHQKQVQRGEIQRVVLHVRVDKVHGRARHLASVREGQISGIEPIHSFAFRQFCDDGVEMQRLLLG